MPIHLKLDTGVTWLANKYISYQMPEITGGRKEAILPATKWNLLVTGFNASTVLVTAAVAFAVLLSFQKAFVFGALGLGLRFVTEKALKTHIMPVGDAAPDDRQWKDVALHMFGIRPASLNDAILARLGVRNPGQWEENAVDLEDFNLALWKNRVPIPN